MAPAKDDTHIDGAIIVVNCELAQGEPNAGRSEVRESCCELAGFMISGLGFRRPWGPCVIL